MYQGRLLQTGRDLRGPARGNCRRMPVSNYCQVGEFAWYRQVRTHSMTVGRCATRFCDRESCADSAIPCPRWPRHQPGRQGTFACEMDQMVRYNYHYLVPSFSRDQAFSLAMEHNSLTRWQRPRARHAVKPVVLGPLRLILCWQRRVRSSDKLELP